ncbi:hypothetical protein [Croceimicrobium sp.]|uniref:hypothetical protein n=1 Tax=Croceimicrobium sp. TaxID=2828340 RepID=UPI003BAB3EF3
MAGIDTLKKKLDAYIRKYYALKLVRGLVFWTGFSLITYLLWSGVEYFGRFPSGTRAILFWSYTVLFSLWLMIYVLVPLLRMLRITKGLNYESAASEIGRALPGLDNRILNTLTLEKAGASDSSLLMAAIEQKLQDLDQYDFNQFIAWRKVLKVLPLLWVPLLLVAILFYSDEGQKFLDSGRRLVYYNQDFIPPAPFRFLLPEDNLEVAYGESISLDLDLEGSQIPSELSAEVNGLEYLPVKTGPRTWTLKVENIQQDLKIRFKALEYYSESRNVDVYQKPAIGALYLSLEPPAYTRVPKSNVALSSLHRVPLGSKLNLRIEDAKHLEMAALILRDSALAFQEGNLSFRAMQDLTFSLELRNNKVQNQVFQGSRIQVIPDAYPDMRILQVDSLSLNRWRLNLAFKDDYGISRLERVLSQGDRTWTKNFYPKGSSFSDEIDLDTLSDAESSVSVYYRVWDNDGVNGSKSSSSERIELLALSKDQEERANIQKLKNFSASSEERRKELRSMERSLDRLQLNMLDRNSLDWKEKENLKEDLQKLAKQQEERIKEREKLKEALEKLDEEKLPTEELQKRLEEANKEEDRLKALEEEIRALMEKLDMKDLKQKLDQLQAENKEQLRKEERMEDLLEDLAFQRDLLQQADKLNELSEKLKAEAQKDDLDQKANQEAQKDFQEAKEELERLAESNKQLDDLLSSEEFKESEQKTEEGLQESSEQKQSGDSKKANESEQKSSEGAKEMSESLMAMMSQMQSQALSMNMQSLRRILENLKQFSKDVEQNGLEVTDLGKDDPRYRFLLTEQSRLLAGSQVIQDSLEVLAAKAPQIKDEVFKELAKMMRSLELAKTHLQNQEKPQSAVQHQYSMMAANELALMLDASLQNMMSMMASQKQGNQNCEKPGGGKPKPGQMSDKLSQMGQKVDKLQKGSKDGKGKPGPSSQEIGEILSEQEALRRMIENAESEEKGGGGNGDKKSELLEELDKMEDLLLEKNIGAYKERMKRVETRLLENEKALEERKQKEEREAEIGSSQSMLDGSANDTLNKEGSKDAYQRSVLNLVPFYQSLIYGKN